MLPVREAITYKSSHLLPGPPVSGKRIGERVEIVFVERKLGLELHCLVCNCSFVNVFVHLLTCSYETLKNMHTFKFV